MSLKLRPVRMKNSLYLLVPKGISQLLEIDESRECVLTTDSIDSNPVLHYSFDSHDKSRDKIKVSERKKISREVGLRKVPAA